MPYTVARPGGNTARIRARGPYPWWFKAAPAPADHHGVSVSATSGPPASVQMALLAKVLDAARPAPAASPVQAVAQAASSQALLQAVTGLDILA